MPFTIMIPKADNTQLENGEAVKVTINSKPARLRKSKGYLRSKDGRGKKKRYKILVTERSFDYLGNECMSYGCASNEEEARYYAHRRPELLYENPETGEVSTNPVSQEIQPMPKDCDFYLTAEGGPLPEPGTRHVMFTNLSEQLSKQFYRAAVLPSRSDLQGLGEVKFRVVSVDTIDSSDIAKLVVLECVDERVSTPLAVTCLNLHLIDHDVEVVEGALVRFRP